ncbi:MATE family efflux transporter [Chloroflexota bacterium]
MKNALEKDWTQGSIVQNLWFLSWPMLVSQSLNMIGPTLDMIWVGRLGSASIAGVGVAAMAVMLINSLLMGLQMGARAMVARAIGAGDKEAASHAAQQAFVVAGGFALVIVPLGMFLAEPILVIMGLEADVIAEGAAYMRLMFIAAAGMSFRMIVDGIMQASGDSVTPMRIAVVFRIVQATICPLLIFGVWIFPDMGVRGAAVAEIIGQVVALSIGIRALFGGHTRLRLTVKDFHLDPGIIWRIVKIGIPASIMGMQRSLGNLVLVKIIVPFGTVAVAAHTLCQRMEMFILMPAMGIGMGSGVLAGQNMGAAKPDRAEKSVWIAAGVVEGLMVCSSICILLWAEHLIGIFGPEPEVRALGAQFLRIATAGFVVFGFEPVLMHSLSGVGDTLPPMLATVISFWVLIIPLGYFLPQITDLGVHGVRWAMAIGMIAIALSLVAYFKLGRWKRKKV